MRATDIRSSRAVRPEPRDETGNDAGHDPDGLQPAVSGDRGSAVRPQFARLDGVVPAAGRPNQTSGSFSGGGQRAPGPGRADGGAVGADGGGERDRGPRFDRAVPDNGYAWWYVDALSDDRRHGITLIAFVGSVFSPYYAFARRRGSANPLDHCALNVALYGDSKRWAMTERRHGAIARDERHFRIGPSQVVWDGAALTIEIDEITNPLPSRLRGTIRVHPSALTETGFDLHASGRHRWWPIAPCARVQVDLAQPGLRWIGDGYFDLNHGDVPLEQDFVGWEWSRASTRRGTVISYDTSARDGQNETLALRIDPSGAVERIEPLARTRLPRTGWRIARSARADTAHPVKVVRTLEDAPFYARSQLEATLCGETTDIMHESLSLDRFRRPIVQAMLPFRMPRW